MNLTQAGTDLATWIQIFDALKSSTIAGALDIDLVHIDNDSLVLQMPVTDASRQPFGLLHGGASMVLAETAGSLHACWGVDLDEVVPVGIEINGSHLSSVREGTVRAEGRVVRRGRTLIVHEVDVVHVESQKLLCKARVTNLYRPRPSS